MKKIKNLLFDLGGVIMDIRKENCIEAFNRLGLKNASSYFGDFCQQGPFMLLERGDITPSAFHEALRRDLPAGVTDALIDEAFCKFLIGIPPHRLDALEHLHRSYRIYLLSNTNRIMWDAVIRNAFTQRGKTIDYYFDGIVTSFEANALKPEAKIFEYVIERLGILPEETLFLDDSIANLDASSDFGFNTLHVPTDAEFAELLESEIPALDK